VFTNACFAAFVANTWDQPIAITVDQGGSSLPANNFAYQPMGGGASLTYAPLSGGMLPPGGIAILFLSDAALGGDCPMGVNVATKDQGYKGTGIGKAFHITTTAPVTAYDIFPYGGGSSAVTSATLLLPVSVWDTNYVAVTAYESTIDGAYPWISLVASEDNTTVMIQPTAAIVGGSSVASAPANMTKSYALMKGQIIRFDQMADLSGSPIVADKPIAVWGGNDCADLPNAQVACDGMHQQIPPVKALGHEYAAVRYRDRISGKSEAPPWRIMGVVDGTTLTYDPAAPSSAPVTLNKGQLVEFPADAPFDVKSQDADHPFYLGGHMTGCSTIGNQGAQGCVGDPEFVNVIPQEQYRNAYVFFTDPTYPETNLVLVRARAGMDFKDVMLDCVGTVSNWKPIDSGDQYEYTRVDLVTGNFSKVGMCDNGRHEAHSDGPFTITVWGWGSAASTIFSQAVSYAYPAGAGVKSINAVTVPVL
jgi:hypothetical protein